MNIQEILQQPESQKLEFKSSFGKETIKTLVAFANAKGGSIFLGVSNSRNVIGISASNESVQQWINQVKSLTLPSIVPDAEIVEYKGKTLVEMSIPEYPVKPVSIKGKYFIRKYGSNHLMSLEEIANEHLKTINLSWDYAADPNHTVKDVSLEKVVQFVEKANRLRERPIDDDPLTVLRKFELLRNGNITFGCLLMFGENPTLSTTIDAGRFESETIIKDSKVVRTDLFHEVDECMEFILKHISKGYRITGSAQREEVWEYPLEAIREIVLNMIIHRDYRATADSTIKIYPHRIEFHNPGSLPEGVSLDDILSGRSASIPRNKQIASVFKEAGLIEKYGSGIKRVLLSMQQRQAKEPVFEVVGSFFKVILFPVGGGVNGGVSGGVNGGVNDVLQYIKQNPGCQSHEIKDALHISQRTLERWLNSLKSEGKIEFKGAPKTGGYHPIDG